MSDAKESDEVRAITNVAELLNIAELRNIVTYRLGAERIVNEIESMKDSTSHLEAMVRHVENELEVRFQLQFSGPNTAYLADIGGVFELSEPIVLSQQIVMEFVDQIALMVVYPYLREAVTGLASRLGAEPPILGFIRRGEGSFAPTPNIEERQDGGDDKKVESEPARESE